MNVPAELLGFLHLLWLPAAAVLGILIIRRKKPLTGKRIALGCLWTFLIYGGGFIALIAIGLATCKMDFK